jgi:hypothetical protein
MPDVKQIDMSFTKAEFLSLFRLLASKGPSRRTLEQNVIFDRMEQIKQRLDFVDIVKQSSEIEG